MLLQAIDLADQPSAVRLHVPEPRLELVNPTRLRLELLDALEQLLNQGLVDWHIPIDRIRSRSPSYGERLQPGEYVHIELYSHGGPMGPGGPGAHGFGDVSSADVREKWKEFGALLGKAMTNENDARGHIVMGCCWVDPQGVSEQYPGWVAASSGHSVYSALLTIQFPFKDNKENGTRSRWNPDDPFRQPYPIVKDLSNESDARVKERLMVDKWTGWVVFTPEVKFKDGNGKPVQKPNTGESRFVPLPVTHDDAHAAHLPIGEKTWMLNSSGITGKLTPTKDDPSVERRRHPAEVPPIDNDPFVDQPTTTVYFSED